MRKSSPSFCQDTPDKGSRRHWEVIMIVLTDGKDASSAYCLTTALYCPLPGQYLAIARHKTIRRERKSPLSFWLFTLHQIAWNPDKHWGSERWRVTRHSSPLGTHSSPGYFFIGLRWVNRAFLLHGLRTDSVRRLSSVRRPSGFATVRRPSGFAIRCKKMFDLWNRGISVRRLSSVRRPSGFAIRCKKTFDLWNRGICNPPSIYKQLAKKSGVKSGEESSALFTLLKQLIRKHLHHFSEEWRVFLKLADNRYKLQRITNPQWKGRTFFNSGLQIRWDA